jgi:ParB-like chromosome segregation protein Spo0J
MTMKMELEEVAIGRIRVGRRVRDDLGDLKSLEKSITRIGLLSPLLVGKDYQLLAGARRLQACRNLGHKTVPVLKVSDPVGGVLELDIQCDENLCRRPLTMHELKEEIERKKAFLGRSPMGAAVAAVLSSLETQKGEAVPEAGEEHP